MIVKQEEQSKTEERKSLIPSSTKPTTGIEGENTRSCNVIIITIIFIFSILAFTNFEEFEENEISKCKATQRMVQLSKQTSQASEHCEKVSFHVMFYSEPERRREVINNSVTLHPSRTVSEQSERDCFFLFYYPQTLGINSEETWTHFPLEELPIESDAQRSLQSIKILAPFLFPTAKEIYYGDLKCPLKLFKSSVDGHDFNEMVIFHKHRHFRTETVQSEFEHTIQHLKKRKEPDWRFDEIDTLRKRYEKLGYFDNDRANRMPDTLCIKYQSKNSSESKILSNFSCNWNQELAISFREQLSVNFALDTTNGISYRFVHGIGVLQGYAGLGLVDNNFN